MKDSNKMPANIKKLPIMVISIFLNNLGTIYSFVTIEKIVKKVYNRRTMEYRVKMYT